MASKAWHAHTLNTLMCMIFTQAELNHCVSLLMLITNIEAEPLSIKHLIDIRTNANTVSKLSFIDYNKCIY